MRINNRISRLGLAMAASIAAAGAVAAGNTQDVSVSSNPSGAAVTIDGQPLGQTPGTASLRRDQKHTVVVSKDGFQPQTIEVSPMNGGLVPPSIIVELEPNAVAPAPAAPVAEPSVAAAQAEAPAAAPSQAAPAEEAEAIPATPIPPPGFLSGDRPPNSLRKNPTAQLVMGSFIVRMGTTTLAEVRNAVGAGQMLQQGHGGKYRAWLCYTIPEGANGALSPQRVWLVASELNGGVQIDGIDAARLPASFGASPACPELPAQLAAVHFDNGLWLGSTKADLLRSLGAPGIDGDSGWSYSYADEGPNYVVHDLLQTQIEDGRITALHAGRELKS